MAVVYQHIRLDKNEPFYIGIGKSIKRAYNLYSSNRNKIWNAIFNKSNIKVEILYDDIPWKDACIIERELIKKFGRIDISTGILSNMTEGGDGLLNPSIEIREKKRKSMIGKNKGDNHWMHKYKDKIHPMLGKTHTIECKNKLSLYRKNKRPNNAISIKAFKNGVLIGEFKSIMEAGKILERNFKHISVLIKENKIDRDGFHYEKLS